MISVNQKGDFSKTFKYLEQVPKTVQLKNLDKYGKEGVSLLAKATPTDTGKTAASWYYQITRTRDSISIEFLNSNVNKGVPIAIILDQGHGTRRGGWVQGRKYIEPTIRPFFDKMANEIWNEVKAL